MNFRTASSRTLFAALSLSLPAFAQAPHALTPAEEKKIDSLVQAMTLEQKLAYIGGTGFAIRAVPALNLPALEMSDGPYGTRSNEGFPSTTYAAGIGLAASWDRELASRVGGGIGRDARARGVHFMLGPGVNIYRSPRNGRNFEYFGEDPFLAAQITVGYITGMQQQGVSATVKHFLGNNSEYLRHDSDSIIEERALWEIYLPTFEAAVKQAHVGAIMDSYNLINGAHSTQNPFFNIDVVRKQWGFPGIMMSDWDATYSAVGAANGGLDLEMPTGKFMNPANLTAAVQSGAMTANTIDDKIRHILTTTMQFGWLDRPQADPTISYLDAQNRAAALDSARESAVLLKNERSLLPLDKSKVRTILVVGPNAYPGEAVGGGSAGVVPFQLVSPLQGMENALPGAKVFYDRGLPSLASLARATEFSTAATNGKPGLTVEVFANDELSGTPVATSSAAHINSLHGRGGSGDETPALLALANAGAKHASRRYSGYYNAPAAGRYLVALGGGGENSGNRVLIDDKEVIDDWKLVRADQPVVALDLAAGPHKVVVEYWTSNPFDARLELAIAPQDGIVSQRAVELARHADAVLVAVGFDHESESEGGDRTFSLPFGQDALINAMAAANPKTIVSVTAGGNVDSRTWLDHVPALLASWYGGQEGGTALAEIIFGDVNPSGHLPVTFERRAEDNPTYTNYYPEAGGNRVVYKEGIFVGYRGYEHNHVTPLFPFGFGLSYTTFKFANLAVSPASLGANPHVTVTFDLTNSGSRAGADVAQVYVSDDHASFPHPDRQLKGFERVQLAPGETRHVSVELDPRAFAHYDTTRKKWAIDPGRFTIHAGDSVDALPLQAPVELNAQAASTAF